MRVNRLKLENFRSHRATEIQLDRINCFIGANNSGKSSLKGAIEYLLTGRAQDWTDAKGAGADALVRHGEKKAVIEADIEGIGTVRRVIHTTSTPNKLEIEGHQGTPTVLMDLLHRALGVNSDTISAAINTSRFVDLPAGEQKDTLSRLAGLTFDEESVRGVLGGRLEGVAGDVFARIYPRGLEGGPEVFDQLDKRARDARLLAKKDLADLQKRHELAGEEASSLPPGVTLADRPAIEEQLGAIAGELASEKSRHVKAYARNQVRATYTDREHRLQDEIKYFESKLDGRGLKDLAVIEERLAEQQAKVDDLSRRLTEQKAALAAAEAEAAALDRTLNNLKDLAGKCPLAPKQLACLHSPDDLATLRQSLAADRGAAGKRDAALRGEVEATEKTLALIRPTVVTAQTDLNAATAYNAEVAQLEERERSVLAAMERAKAEQDQAGEEEDLGALQQAIAEIEARINRGREILAILDREATAARDREKLAAAVEQGRAEVEALEELVKAFGSNGVKAEMLAGLLGPIEARTNERLEALTDGAYRLRFDAADGGFRVLVDLVAEGVTVDLRHLSTSERLRVGVILQDTLNSLTGLGLLVIDDVEVLDPDNRARLMQLLLAVAESYDTVLVFAVRGDVEPQDPGIEGLAMWMVEGGQVRRLEAAVAA